MKYDQEQDDDREESYAHTHVESRKISAVALSELKRKRFCCPLDVQEEESAVVVFDDQQGNTK